MALNANVLAALGPFLLAELSIDQEQFGYLAGSAGVAGAVGSLLLGPTVDRVGRRLPMCWGMVVFVLASIGHMLAADFGGLLVVRSVAGFAAGVVFTSASAAVADMVPYERRGRAMGVFTAGMFLGMAVGLPLAQVMASYGWWQGIFLLQTVVGAVAMVAYWRVLPVDIGLGQRFLENLPKLLNLQIFASLVSVMLYVGGFFTVVQFVGTWLDAEGIIPRTRQGWVWLILGLSPVLGAIFLTRLSDRFGKRRFVMLATLVVALGIAGLTLVDGLWGLLLVGMPIALFSGSRSGPFQALISEMVSADARGTLMGLRSTFVNLGTGLFPMVCGWVYKSGNLAFDGVLLVAAGGIFLSYLLVQLWVKQK